MRLGEYSSFDGLGLAGLLARGETTPRELGAALVTAHAAINPHINAVVELYADALEALGDRPGAPPFYGLPILTKDFPIEAGRPTEFGSIIARGYRSPFDHVFWRRLREGGLVNVGRTATSEFGLAAATESSLYGATRNPWDLARGVSGSSGGSAAAIAAGIVPFAQAADGGGSIRTPASYCGLVGLKPSRGRVSSAPESNAPLFGLATEFMLTRSVRDCAVLLDLASGAVPGDSYEIGTPEISYSEAIQRPSKPLKIALCAHSWSSFALEDEVRDAVLAIGRQLQAMGHHVSEAAPKFDYETYLAAQKVIWGATTVHGVEEIARAVKRPFEPSQLQEATRAVYRYGQSLSAAALVAALATYDEITRTVGEFLADYDVLVTPTCARTPDLIGTYDPSRPGQTIDSVFDDLAPKETFTALFNATGSPALSLPLAWSAAGLPIGIQFIGRFGSEDRLLGLARILEEEHAWGRRLPPNHVTASTQK